MSPIKESFYSIDRGAVQLGAFFGVLCSVMALSGFYFLFPVFLFFASVPVLLAYLARGAAVGHVAFVVSTLTLALLSPTLRVFCDFLLNALAPAALMGYFSIQSKTEGRKIWWYPESLLLRNFMIFSLISLLIQSFTICSESSMRSIVTEFVAAMSKHVGTVGVDESTVDIIVNYSVGVGVVVKMFITMLNFQFAHVLSYRLKSNIRKDFHLLHVRLRNWMVLLPLGSLCASYVIPQLSFWLSGIFVVGMFASVIGGVSMLHSYYEHHHRKRILVAYYLTLFMMPVPVLCVTAAIGVIDCLYPMRAKLGI